MIKTATTADMSAVVRIVRNVQLNVQDPQPGVQHKGFIVYALNEIGYARRENPYLTVSTLTWGIYLFLV